MFAYHKFSTNPSVTSSNSTENSGSGRATALQVAKRASSIIIGLTISLLVGAKAEAVTLNFTKVADTSTHVPHTNENFFGFGNPALYNTNVAFMGMGPSEQGIYLKTGHKLYIVADTNTTVPGGNGETYFGFGEPSIDQKTVAFTHLVPQGGIYTKKSQSGVQVVADSNSNNFGHEFLFFDPPSVHNGSVAFSATYRGVVSNSYKTGIFKKVAGRLNEEISFYNSFSPEPCIDVVQSVGNPVYEARANTTDLVFDASGYCNNPNDIPREVIFKTTNNVRNEVVDSNTRIPGGSGNFNGFSEPALAQGNIVFVGYGTAQKGIYQKINSVLSKVADLNTVIPGSSNKFTDFRTPIIDNGNVVFIGLNSSSLPGIYTNIGGSLKKVIATNDSLGGKTVSSVSAGREALSGNKIAFQVSFTDGSQAIYIATVQ